MTECSWWAVDGEDSFMSDITYMMGVSITNKRTGEMFPLQTKAIKIDTTRIGKQSSRLGAFFIQIVLKVFLLLCENIFTKALLIYTHSIPYLT